MDPAEGSCCTLSVSLRDLQAPHIPMDRLRCAFCLGVFRDLEAISLASIRLAWIEYSSEKHRLQAIVYGDGDADDYTQLIEFKNISDQDK